MGPISVYSGQQSVSPLTKQLREQERPDTGPKNRDMSGERIARTQEANSRVATSKGASDRNLTTQTPTSNQNQPSPNAPRGSVIDMMV